jgi:hypothetical protein
MIYTDPSGYMAYGTSNSSANLHFTYGNPANDIAYYIDGMSVSAGEFNMFFNMEMASGGGVEIEGGGTFGVGESILDKYIAIFGDYQKAVEFYQRQLASLSNTSFWQEITYKSKVTQAELEEERKIVNCPQYDFEYQINDWAIKITSPSTSMYYIHDYQSGGGNNTSISSSSTAQTVNTVATVGGLVTGATQQIVKIPTVAYNIAYNNTLLKGVRYLKPVSYWATGVSFFSDVYLTSTGQQSLGETIMNTAVTGVAIGIGGWTGFVIQANYQASKAYMETLMEHPDWAPYPYRGFYH